MGYSYLSALKTGVEKEKHSHERGMLFSANNIMTLVITFSRGISLLVRIAK